MKAVRVPADPVFSLRVIFLFTLLFYAMKTADIADFILFSRGLHFHRSIFVHSERKWIFFIESLDFVLGIYPSGAVRVIVKRLKVCRAIDHRPVPDDVNPLPGS